jgi:hypothetical protein
MKNVFAHWYNYVTKEYETVNPVVTDEKAMALLPQIPAAQNLYKAYRESGRNISAAMVLVLEACVGKKEQK